MKAMVLRSPASLDRLILEGRADLGDRGAIRPVIDRGVPLEQLADAFRFEMDGGHFGKIGIEW